MTNLGKTQEDLKKFPKSGSWVGPRNRVLGGAHVPFHRNRQFRADMLGHSRLAGSRLTQQKWKRRVEMVSDTLQ